LVNIPSNLKHAIDAFKIRAARLAQLKQQQGGGSGEGDEEDQKRSEKLLTLHPVQF
jgi:hypothetical protein